MHESGGKTKRLENLHELATESYSYRLSNGKIGTIGIFMNSNTKNQVGTAILCHKTREREREEPHVFTRQIYILSRRHQTTLL